MKRRIGLVCCIAPVFAGTGGCVERILTVQSNPPGALVYLNGQEMGRTPVQRDFTWYGTYDVTVRCEGYQTIKKPEPVIAPFYEWVPIDLVAELLPIPLKDHHTLTYNLQPMPAATEASPGLMTRAEQLKGELESSHFPPTTRKSK
ncbi:MAG: PEGA domain-containing protein [Tepidisphaeraceae bacterium]